MDLIWYILPVALSLILWCVKPADLLVAMRFLSRQLHIWVRWARRHSIACLLTFQVLSSSIIIALMIVLFLLSR